MDETRFWMIRHAIVEESARARLYGVMDVPLCPEQLLAQRPLYAALAHALPREAAWIVSPLSRTHKTAAAIFAAGYKPADLRVEPGLIEQDLGDYQGMPHADLPARLTLPAHPFWPLAATERPPNGESFADVIARVGPTMERLAADHAGHDVVAVSHGGAIRAAVAHALDIEAEHALHLSVQNISLTRLERLDRGWRVVCVNALPAWSGD